MEGRSTKHRIPILLKIVKVMKSKESLKLAQTRDAKATGHQHVTQHPGGILDLENCKNDG